MKIRKCLVLCGLSLLPMLAPAASLEDMERRINQLEDQVAVLSEANRDAQRHRSDFVNVSGYADLAAQRGGGEHATFQLGTLALFFKKQITDQWRLFSEVEFEEGPDIEAGGGEGTIALEHFIIDYLHDPKASFRAGRLFGAAGIWSLYHFSPYVPTHMAPMHIYNIFPKMVDGAEMFGTVPMNKTFVSYHLYTSNGQGNNAVSDMNRDKAFGLRVSAVLPALKYLEVGASAYEDRLNTNTNGYSDRKRAYGLHLKTKFDAFTIQAEYARGSKSNLDVIAANGHQASNMGYYVQALYDVKQWTFGVRNDYYDEDLHAGGRVLDNTLIGNYHVSKDLVLKLEHHIYKGSTVNNTTVASVAVNLGN